MGGLFPCYAFKLANGRLRDRYLANKNVAPYRGEQDYERNKINPFHPRWWPEKLEQPRKRKKPAGIFLDDMSDWMGSYWPEEWTEAELQMMRDCPQHRFYTLTKQPQNLIKFKFPDNCWVGVTMTADGNTDAGYYLSRIEATVKFISFEPLLRWAMYGVDKVREALIVMGVNWLIIGALTGTKYELLEVSQKWNISGINQGLTMMPYGKKWTLQPEIEWVEEIVRAADKAGVKVFQKDNLKPLLGNNLRQELPE